MEFANKESSILEMFRTVETSECIAETEETKEIFELINKKNYWKYWTDSSGKSDPPPDFYSDEFGLMMEVMRIDDNAYPSEKNGKTNTIDPVTIAESRMYNELKENGITDLFPDANIMTIPHLVDMPIDKYCGYERYVNNFARIVEKHKANIPAYRKNHPGYSLIFFIMDESGEYIEVSDEFTAKKKCKVGEEVHGKRHLPFFDKTLISPIVGSDIDFVVWYMPYKLL